MTARHIYILTGQVQGVGFRPFIYREATDLAYKHLKKERGGQEWQPTLF